MDIGIRQTFLYTKHSKRCYKSRLQNIRSRRVAKPTTTRHRDTRTRPTPLENNNKAQLEVSFQRKLSKKR